MKTAMLTSPPPKHLHAIFYTATAFSKRNSPLNQMIFSCLTASASARHYPQLPLIPDLRAFPRESFSGAAVCLFRLTRANGREQTAKASGQHLCHFHTQPPSRICQKPKECSIKLMTIKRKISPHSLLLITA